MVYIGQTRSRSLIAELSSYGFGEITQRHELPPRRLPWAFDNGAFGDWRAKRPFSEDQYRAALAKAPATAQRPAFVAVPDRVAGGVDSLALSLEWVEECSRVGPPYLVVQDGMLDAHVEPGLDRFAGLFVGGTLEWKVATGAGWVRLAHRHGKLCHVGRVGTVRRVAWAKRIGVDSIDSCLPLWSREKLAAFVAAVRGEVRQLGFDLGGV